MLEVRSDSSYKTTETKGILSGNLSGGGDDSCVVYTGSSGKLAFSHRECYCVCLDKVSVFPPELSPPPPLRTQAWWLAKVPSKSLQLGHIEHNSK